jgi:hypothetical protein
MTARDPKVPGTMFYRDRGTFDGAHFDTLRESRAKPLAVSLSNLQEMRGALGQ